MGTRSHAPSVTTWHVGLIETQRARAQVHTSTNKLPACSTCPSPRKAAAMPPSIPTSAGVRLALRSEPLQLLQGEEALRSSTARPRLLPYAKLSACGQCCMVVLPRAACCVNHCSAANSSSGTVIATVSGGHTCWKSSRAYIVLVNSASSTQRGKTQAPAPRCCSAVAPLSGGGRHAPACGTL